FSLGLLRAQPSGSPPQMSGRSMERVERFKKMRLVEMLDLKEDQSVRFFARFNDFENARKELNRQKDETFDKIERLLRNKADQKEYEKLFDEVEVVNRKIGDEKLKFFNSLGDLLTIEQRAKLILFERRFEHELREAVKESQDRRRGRFEDN
ncbi:MAG: hypothetical protein ABI623_09870, partial [bacterium]